MSTPVACRIFKQRFVVYRGRWGGPDRASVHLLNATERSRQEFDPIGPVPDKDYDSAIDMCKRFDGEVLTPPPRDTGHVVGRVY